jgi:hypothetical protein
LTNKKIVLTISNEVGSLTRERLKIRPKGGEKAGGRYESLLRKRGLKNNFSLQELL